jgi:serine/threonine protein kinase
MIKRDFLKQTIRINVPEVKEITIHKIHYKINSIIGIGMNGSVFLATDTTNNRLVAMKWIEVEDDMEHVKEIENELECLRRLQKNCDQYVLCYIDSDIVSIEEDIDDNIFTNYYVIITKFLEGYITWKSFKKKYLEGSKERKRALENIEEGLRTIHEKKIAHGDVHSENVLIHPDTLDIRWIDFGACQIDPTPSMLRQDLENASNL